MARTTVVAVSDSTPTPLPSSPLTTRRYVVVENSGANDIFVGYDGAGALAGTAHTLGAGERMEFPGGDVLFAATSSAQSGGAGDCTIVTEID